MWEIDNSGFLVLCSVIPKDNKYIDVIIEKDIMKKVEEQILEEYAREYNIASTSYEIMGLMLNSQYVEERLKLFNLENIYLYGGTYMAVQLYRIGKAYVDIKGIVDKSRRIVLNEKVSVLTLSELKEKYNNEKIIITPMRFFNEIKEELQLFVNIENILGIGELMMGTK